MAKKHKKHKSGHTRGYEEEQELRDVGGKKMRVVFRMASPPPDTLVVSYSLEAIARARQILSQPPGTSQKQKKHKKKKKHAHGHKEEELTIQAPQPSNAMKTEYSFVPSYSLPTSTLFDEEDKVEIEEEEEEEEEVVHLNEEEEVRLEEEEEEEVSLPVEIDLQRLSLSSQESQQHSHRRRSDKKKKKKKHKHKHHRSESGTVEEQQLPVLPVVPPQAEELMEEEDVVDQLVTHQSERGGKSATVCADDGVGGGWKSITGGSGGKSMRCSDDGYIETDRVLADQRSPSPVSRDQYTSRKPIPSPSLSSQSASSPASSVRHTMRLPKGALKYFLKHIHSQILRRDPDGVFNEPVTDDIAPGYTSIIKQPMDLQTMSGKIEGNEYPSVKEFKEDFVLMCNNAMTYNSPETLYYHTAKNLLSVGLKIITKELSVRPDIRLGIVASSHSPQPPPAVTETHIPLSSSTTLLDYSSPFMCRIDLSLLSRASHKDSPLGVGPTPLATDDIVKIDVSGYEEEEEVVNQSHLTRVHVGFEEEEEVIVMEEEETVEELAGSVENMEEEILAQVEEVGDNLREGIERNNQSLASLTFVNKMSDGGTTMSILNPDTSVSFDRPVDLTVLSEKVKAGHSAATVLNSELPLFRATPVNYLMYGPFGSFAPTFDSSFATLTKQDSDLLLSTYGSDLGVSYANSLQQFVKGSGSFVSEMADAILNGLTGGRHGNFMETVRKEEKLKSEQEGKVDEMERKPSKIEGEEAVSVSESADQFKTGGDEEQRMDVEVENADKVLPQMNEKEGTEEVANSEYDEEEKNVTQSYTRDESNEECVEIPETQSEGSEDTLARTSRLLLTLEEQQDERLSQPPSHTQDGHYVLSQPTQKELETVSQLTAGLADLTSQVAPSDLVSVPVLHKAMGIHMEPTAPHQGTPGDHHS